MKLFNFSKNKRSEGDAGIISEKLSNVSPQEISKDSTQFNLSTNDKPPEIPENLFVEYEKPKKQSPMDPNETTQEVNNLQTLYNYLEQNLEKKGYEDALMNPDTSYMQEHIVYLQNELNLMISKVNTYYKTYIRQIDFHIETRKRNDMIEMVDELITHKASVEDEVKIVSEIEDDAKRSNGITQNVILSYKRGFKNGFAAITYGTILTKRN